MIGCNDFFCNPYYFRFLFGYLLVVHLKHVYEMHIFLKKILTFKNFKNDQCLLEDPDCIQPDYIN